MKFYLPVEICLKWAYVDKDGGGKIFNCLEPKFELFSVFEVDLCYLKYPFEYIYNINIESDLLKILSLQTQILVKLHFQTCLINCHSLHCN